MQTNHKKFRQADVDYILMMFRHYKQKQRYHLKPLTERIIPDNDREAQISWESYAGGFYRASKELMDVFVSCLYDENNGEIK